MSSSHVVLVLTMSLYFRQMLRVQRRTWWFSFICVIKPSSSWAVPLTFTAYFAFLTTWLSLSTRPTLSFIFCSVVFWGQINIPWFLISPVCCQQAVLDVEQRRKLEETHKVGLLDSIRQKKKKAQDTRKPGQVGSGGRVGDILVLKY